jgi:S1-C subfamily serine protease
VVITYIEEGSPAEKAGLMVGDVITKIESTIISSKEDFIEVTSKIKGSCLVKTGRGYFVLKEN